MAQQTIPFALAALERNYAMPQTAITQVGQTVDIELDSVPGWATSIDVLCQLDVAINVAAGGTAPTLSQFAPYNFFRELQISLGGGPFQRVNPYFYYLREILGSEGWQPDKATSTYGYSTSELYNVPAVTATAGTTTDNIWQFVMRVPLQLQHGSTVGMLPMGNSSTKVKLRLTVQPQLVGSDSWQNPLVGGTNVTASVGNSKPSYVKPMINYMTTPPNGAPVDNPVIGSILNVQERTTAFTGAGTLTPIKFPDPFKYLRLYHIVIDGTGMPNTTGVQAFELDLAPGYPQFSYPTQDAMQEYFWKTRRLYKNDLPTGVFVFDLYTGSDPVNPNGTQIINGSQWQTMQTQLAVTSGTNVSQPAKIITFAEALSPVGF